MRDRMPSVSRLMTNLKVEMDSFDLDSITSTLVAASLDQSNWTDALGKVAELTNSFGAVLLPVIGDVPLLYGSSSMDRSFERYVEGGWINQDERYRGKMNFLRNGIMTDDDCLPEHVRKRSPFYQDFIAASGLTEFAGVRVGRRDDVWNLSIQRTKGQGQFSATELSALASLSDSLDSVVEVSRALGLAKGHAALDAFQFSDRAAVLLDRSGDVVHANGAAEALLGDDLKISQRRVVSHDRGATAVLDQALRTLLWTRKTSLVPPVVFPKSADGKLLIYPMRLKGLTDSPFSAFHAILVIVDPEASLDVPATTLRTAFNLTATESRLAVAIGGGSDLDAFAKRMAISKETARSQLKAIFAKTGVRRQHELAALLGTLIPKR